MDVPALLSPFRCSARRTLSELENVRVLPAPASSHLCRLEAGHAPDLDGGSGRCGNQRQACCAMLSVFSHIGPAAVANQTGQAPAAIRYV